MQKNITLVVSYKSDLDRWMAAKTAAEAVRDSLMKKGIKLNDIVINIVADEEPFVLNVMGFNSLDPDKNR